MTNPFPSLEQLLSLAENEHVEFKKAEHHYDFEELVKYCKAARWYPGSITENCNHEH